MLDLFCGRFGWSKAFAARGWECVGVDLVEPAEIPQGCEFVRCDVRQLSASQRRIGVRAQIFGWLHSWGPFDFACASSPCEKFSVFGMKHFNPNPPYPADGIELFNFIHNLLEQLGVPYVMENVRAAQQFVGKAAHHCGPFYLWGNGVPVLMPQGIKKGWGNYYIDKNGRKRVQGPTGRARGVHNPQRHTREISANVATIPPELSSCVADYAERILTMKSGSVTCLTK